MQILFIFTIISLSALPTSSVNLECFYSDRNDYGYKCDVTSLRITSKDDRVITKILGTHNPRKNDQDVKFFDAIGKTIHFFPRGDFFPNLEILQIYGSNLKEISSLDLENFKNLRILWLSSNEIEVIEENLMENLKNLEWVDFSYNKIKHVDAKSFENLKGLKSLVFDSNLCHSGNAVNDPAGVGVLIEKIEEKCVDVGYAVKERMRFKDFSKSLESKITDLTSNLTAIQTTLDREKNENFALKKENQDQSQEIRDLKLEKIKQIKIKNSLDVENLNFKQEISQLKAQIDKIVNENNCGFLNEIIGDLKEAREERKSILAAVSGEKSGNFGKDEKLRILKELKEENEEILSMLTNASAERFEIKNDVTQSCSSLALQHFYKLQEIGEILKGVSGVVGRRRQ